MISGNQKPLAAISYQTSVYALLDKFIKKYDPRYELIRIDPTDFFANPNHGYQYINLVIRDFKERRAVSDTLDTLGLDRFTYVDPRAVVLDDMSFGQGCMIYPLASCYSAHIGKDVILHSRCNLAENVTIGDGSFISGGALMGGSVKIGKRCFISLNVTILDHVVIADDVHLLPSMTIKKNIVKSGKFYNPYVFAVKEFRDIGFNSK